MEVARVSFCLDSHLHAVHIEIGTLVPFDFCQWVYLLICANGNGHSFVECWLPFG